MKKVGGLTLIEELCLSKYYPVYIDLKEKNALVVGGGKVAERKVCTLIKTGAKVTVVSPILTKKLSQLKDKKRFRYIKGGFKKSHMDGMFIVICATDKKDINYVVSSEAKERNILVNVVDQPEECNFIVPSIVERGDLLISISTCGNSPAFAKKIRKRLEGEFGNEYSEFLKIMGSMRGYIKKELPSPDIRKIAFDNIINKHDMIEILKKDGKKGVFDKIMEIVKDVKLRSTNG